MSESTDERVEIEGTAGGGMTDTTVLAAVGSVALALYYYYVRGDKQRGEFVGLWPVTILALATYLRIDQIRKLLQER